MQITWNINKSQKVNFHGNQGKLLRYVVYEEGLSIYLDKVKVI